MSRSTLALVIGLFSITVILLGIALRQLPQNAKSKHEVAAVSIAPKPTNTPKKATLKFLQSPLYVTQTASASAFEVLVDSGDYSLTDVQLELKYDPDKIKLLEIEQGSFFGTNSPILNNIDEKTGRISFAIGLAPSQTAKRGKGPVAKISFLPASSLTATSSISFLPKTVVLAKDFKGSILETSDTATIFLFPLATPTLFPTKKITATPTPIKSEPTASASPILTSTP